MRLRMGQAMQRWLNRQPPNGNVTHGVRRSGYRLHRMRCNSA